MVAPGCCRLHGVFCVRRDFVFFLFVLFLFERTRPASSMRPPCLIYLSTSICFPPEGIFQVYVLEGLWIPDKGIRVLQNFQTFRVRVWKCYRTHRSSGYCGKGVRNSQKFRKGIQTLYPFPGYCGHGRTELTVFPGTGMNVTQNLQKFFVG